MTDPAGARSDRPRDPPPGRTARWVAALERWIGSLRSRSGLVETAARVMERDRDAAGTLLGSALAMRLFLFLVPVMLTAVGIAGLLGLAGVGSFADDAEFHGIIGREIDAAFDQNTTSAALATVIGVVGIGWTGRSLARALVLSSALSWQMGGGQRTAFRVIGIVTGIVVSTGLVWAILNRIRANTGLAVASVSYLAVVVAYLVLWTVLVLALPRTTRDPGAVLPGATLIAAVISGLQAVSQLYLPNTISNSSTIYGAVGVTAAMLGWYFIIGRTLALAFSLNAVVFERYSSISHLVFALPVLRQIPRRVPLVARTFELSDP